MEYLIAIIFIVAVASLYFQSRLKAYEQVVYSLNQTVKQLQKAMAELQAKVAASDASPKAPETVDAPAQTASAEVAATEPEAVIEAVDEAPAEPGPVRSVSVPDAVASLRDEVASRPAFEAVETDLSSRWMIWVGGLALALGGAFLVKVSIDAGLLAPGVRVVLACLFGLGLGVAGEAVRRKRGGLSWLEGAPDYLPAALSAAGIFTLFAAIFSAYGLYDLIPPLIAFIGLAIVTLAASALALLQGRFFAYLGLIGGMVVPALVSTGGGSAWALFPYLLFIAAVTLAIARNRVWADVAVSALALALVWVPVWIVINWHTGDGLPVGLYILLLGGASLSLLSGATPARSENASLKAARPLHPVSLASDIVILIAMLLLCATVRLEHYATPSLVLFGL